MPRVELTLEIGAGADRVWEAVVDIERYPETMDSVRWVKLLPHPDPDPAVRRSAWSIVLKGSILEWEEDELLDHDARTLTFTQRSGDMDIFEGGWQVTELAPARSQVRLTIDFEIGIPLLADMLNPVAERSLRDNCREMLLGVEREAVELPPQ